jgi:BASS family bile acid:Na+ symporter
MSEWLDVALKVALVIFMAGSLLEMGLRLDPGAALPGLRDVRFVAYTLLWGFVLGPALAYAITRVLPLEPPYAIGLILMGMTPCAPFLPVIVDKARGDLGYTAAFMLLTAVGMVAFMPVAVPLMVEGLSVTAWGIARPLLLVVFLPLVAGMLLRLVALAVANRMQPVVKKITALATIALAVLLVIEYWQQLLGVPGSLALAAQLVFFFVLTACTYWFGFGLRHEQRIVLSAGMATRNLGAAMAPLFSLPSTDERAMVMLVLALPLMVLFARLGTRWFGRQAATTLARPTE